VKDIFEKFIERARHNSLGIFVGEMKPSYLLGLSLFPLFFASLNPHPHPPQFPFVTLVYIFNVFSLYSNWWSVPIW